ncbi:hypothetical protein [Archangium lansingense]|uniref:Uncharacterized protein n=1 Tax=Archangium lansingense TaxID=2995310 RepID=A0ABT3ZY23_9BACT|nr:hypothetical protein [Archangium lansinium]MCY1074292.1 hypothetical protein [Archangium lansinium]
MGRTAHRALKVALGFVAAALVLKSSWIAERLRGQVEAIATQ